MAGMGRIWSFDKVYINAFGTLQQYLIRLLKPAYDEVGFDEKGDDSNLLNIYKRVDILTSACHLGYKNCIHTCNRQFRIWMDSPNPDTQNP